MAKRINNQWSYELYNSKEEILSVNNYSKSKYFSLFINDEFQGTFEYNSKMPAVEKQWLIKDQAKKALAKYRKEKAKLTKQVVAPLTSPGTKSGKSKWSYELFDSKEKSLRSNSYKKTKYFSIYINDDLQALYELDESLSVDEKKKLIRSQAKIELERYRISKIKEEADLQREFNKIIHEEEREEAEREKEETLEEISSNYEMRGEVHSLTIGFKKRYTLATNFYDLFDMEEREDELLKLTKNNINEAVSNFEAKFPNQKLSNFYVLIKTNKFSDDGDFKYISTGFIHGQKSSIKQATEYLIKQFNKDKSNKEKYGDMFKDEILSVSEMEINILW